MPATAWEDVLLAQLRGAIAGGVDVVQIREADLPAAALMTLTRAVLALAAGTRCRIVVNDRVDLACAAGADGIHLRESSVPIAGARQIGPGLLVGRSVHDARTAAFSRTADYMIAGSVFATASKPGQVATLGVGGLREIVHAAGKCPVWAVGGVTQDRIETLVSCGVKGVAAIGAFFPPRDARRIDGEVEASTRALRFSLDRCG